MTAATTATAAPRAPATAGGAVLREKVPGVVLWMLIFVILVPIEFSARIGPLFLTASKVFLVVISFVILPQLAKLKMRSYDWMMVAHAAWSATAFLIIYGPGTGLERSGFYVLEFLIVYLVARIYLQTIGQIMATVGLLFVMVLLNVIAAVPEGLTGHRFVHEFAKRFTGFYYDYGYESRLGIIRSTAFFEHPILLGVFCSSILSLIWFTSTTPQRMWKVPVIFLGTFFSASSAPLMVFVLQVWLLLIERITRGVRHRLVIVVGIAAVLVGLMQTLTGRGVVGAIALVALNPKTTYYRRGQWENGIDDVLRHPFFGIDPPTFTRPDWMTTSIDNYWLLVMIRSGIPALVFLLLCILLIWLALARRGDRPAALVQLRNGWGMMMVALLLTGATVAFFGKLQPLLSFFIGLGAALANCRLPEAAEEGQTPPALRAAPGYTRFPKGGAAIARVTAEPAPARALHRATQRAAPKG